MAVLTIKVFAEVNQCRGKQTQLPFDNRMN